MERVFFTFFKYTTKAKWLREMTVLDGCRQTEQTTLATWHMHPLSNATSSLD